MHRPTILLLCALLGAFAWHAAAQDKTKAGPEGPTPNAIPAEFLFNASLTKDLQKQDVLELVDANERRRRAGMWLVITDLEVRAATGVYVRLVEVAPAGREGQKKWRTIERRNALFLRNFSISTSGYTGSRLAFQSGLKFHPRSRPIVETVQGAGEVHVAVQGYWTAQ